MPNGPSIVLVDPPPPDPRGSEARGGIKLDWRSEVGRAGVLLDWWPVGRDGDAGVPQPVADALAAGLCAATTVVGCTLEFPPAVGPEWTTVSGGHACRFAGRRVLGFGPRPLGVLASREPAVVARFFDDPTFAWAHESQLLLLAAPDALPRLDRALVEACFRVPVRVTVARLRTAGVVGLLRAGVDGDVAGLYVLDPAWRAPVVRALAEAARAAGGRWEERADVAHWASRAEVAPAAWLAR